MTNYELNGPWLGEMKRSVPSAIKRRRIRRWAVMVAAWGIFTLALFFAAKVTVNFYAN